MRSINLDQLAIPLGLTVNELVTNALKHAFPAARAGVVRVVVRTGPSLSLLVADEGAGCPAQRRGGNGSRLLRLLVRQLGGAISWESGGPTCTVRMSINRAVPRAA